MEMPRLVIAGTHSGVGKTTLTTGLLAALRRRGLRVQSFKTGPDYIDPTCHRWATGRPGRNLDTWLMSRAAVLELFIRGTSGHQTADLAVVEGVMGLYDGAGGQGESGSTALLAKWLGAPVVLVADAGASARSLAAVALGFRAFDPQVTIAGVIANRVGSQRHAEMLRQALAEIGLPLLGVVARDDGLILPESHLGLVVPREPGPAQGWLESAASAVERSLDLDTLLRVARGAPPLASPPPTCFLPEAAGRFAGLRIGVPQDAALWFYYPDSLELLAHLGAEVVPCSLVDDSALPPDLDGLYMGGGFPERQAPALAANAALRDAVARAWRAGIPVHAECGGYLYLHHALTDEEGRLYPMAGCLPGQVLLTRRLQGVGYRFAVPPGSPPPVPADPVTTGAEAEAAPAPAALRGHVFHYTRIEGGPWQPAWDLYRADGSFERADGWAGPGQTASYLHIHLPTQLPVAEHFLAACRAYRRRRRGAG